MTLGPGPEVPAVAESAVPTVVPLGPDHLDAAVALQRACFPEPFPAELLWRREHLESHLSLFAEGQFAALAEDGSLIGTASSLVISEETWQAHRPWAKTTGGFAFTGHDPDGSTLYGADISVHPDHRGRGVARSLYAARFAGADWSASARLVGSPTGGPGR
jgi:ribosomal protein S18 acetylase RimI-like enzyme